MPIIILTLFSYSVDYFGNQRKFFVKLSGRLIYNQKASYRYVRLTWSIFDHGLCPHTSYFYRKPLILFLWRFSDASHYTLTFAIPCIFAFVFQFSHAGVWLQVSFLFATTGQTRFRNFFSFDYRNICLSVLGFDGASLFFRETQLSEFEIDRDLSTYVYYSSLDVLPRQ